MKWDEIVLLYSQIRQFVSMSWSFSHIQVSTFCPKIPPHTLMACYRSPQRCVIHVLASCTTAFTVLQVKAHEPLWPEKPLSSSTGDWCRVWKMCDKVDKRQKNLWCKLFDFTQKQSVKLFSKPTAAIQHGVGNYQHSRDQVKCLLALSW